MTMAKKRFDKTRPGCVWWSLSWAEAVWMHLHSAEYEWGWRWQIHSKFEIYFENTRWNCWRALYSGTFAHRSRSRSWWNFERNRQRSDGWPTVSTVNTQNWKVWLAMYWMRACILQSMRLHLHLMPYYYHYSHPIGKGTIRRCDPISIHTQPESFLYCLDSVNCQKKSQLIFWIPHINTCLTSKLYLRLIRFSSFAKRYPKLDWCVPFSLLDLCA